MLDGDGNSSYTAVTGDCESGWAITGGWKCGWGLMLEYRNAFRVESEPEPWGRGLPLPPSAIPWGEGLPRSLNKKHYWAALLDK